MSARLAAAQALGAVIAGKASLNGSLPAQLDRVAEQDRALVQELALGTARWFPQLEVLANQWLEKPFRRADSDVQALLFIGLYQLLYMRIPEHAAISETVNAAAGLKKKWAKGLLNAVLRKAQAEGAEQLQQLQKDPVVVTAHPRWLQKQLKAVWPEHWLAICEQANQYPPLTLRVNQQRINQADYLALLAEQGIAAKATAYSDVGITLDKPCSVYELPHFAEGWVSVQDEAAQLSAGLLDLHAGQRVLDACCAPGGKTCHILETEANLQELIAIDLEPHRLKRVAENLERLQLTAQLKAGDARQLEQWWDGQLFDRILLDAPCSATGVIRRNPDIKITRQAADIPALATLQGELLDVLWQTLKPGGVLLYATCSILPEENTQVVEAFLERTLGAKQWSIKAGFGLEQPAGRQLFPQAQGHDGFYYARLVKAAE